jgi:uncharacterized protein
MKSSAPRPDQVRVAVFAKAPVAGSVKTRLVALLGEEGAASLHGKLVQQALATAVKAGVGLVELWCTPDDAHPFFGQCVADSAAELRSQNGRDLGERMGYSFQSAFAAGRALVLIGSDCPALTPKHIQAAAAALASYDAVFIPAEDGGYVLVGLSRPMPGIFEGIEWSTEGVMAATRERLRATGARWLELPDLWDVDRPEDFVRMQRERLLQEISS